jgi:hypothetical protein
MFCIVKPDNLLPDSADTIMSSARGPTHIKYHLLPRDGEKNYYQYIDVLPACPVTTNQLKRK